MPDARPNPDALLAAVQEQDVNQRHGSLKIFFGYAAGVGKTYAMLESARREKAQGRDVVVGYVEPHGRRDTEALLEGFESVPLLELEHRGVRLNEFDVDAAIARHPDLILVDELAHTNAEGCRHEKRWQDIQELLAANINVWTTLNVQHIESLNDIVGQITGVSVRERVPDSVFDVADDLELVDITPEELLVRLKAGKVYVPELAERALQNFFQKGHLAALRELSLRQTARRIHTDVELARQSRAALQPWATSERLLVCVGPSPSTSRVVRTAKRMAMALDAPWIAVSIDRTDVSANVKAQGQISQHFRLAESLGAEPVTLVAQNVAQAILKFARERNVTKILIGKTKQPHWRAWLGRNVVDELLEHSGDIDVYVISGQKDKQANVPSSTANSRLDIFAYLKSTAVVAVSTAVAQVFRVMQVAEAEANTVMLFLAAVAWTAFRYGIGPAIYASILAVLVFDFFFVPPLYTFAIADTQYILTFLVMLAIGIVISTLTTRLKRQMENAHRRERRNSVLYELGKQLSSIYGQVFLVSATGEKLKEMFGGEVAIYLNQANNNPELIFGSDTSIAKSPVSIATANWVSQREQMAGAGTNTLPNAVALFIPIKGSRSTLGSIAVRVAQDDNLLDPEQRHLLEACANQLALALERDGLAVEAADAAIAAQTEQLRSSLLSGVSHDLKTPLAVIAGASSSLLHNETLEESTRRQLLETVSDEAARLNRLLENLLQMSKLDSGAAKPNMQWHVLEEIVGSALRRTECLLQGHQVTVELPADLPLLHCDELLIEQVFINLFENAAKHTPTGTSIVVRAAVDGDWLRIWMADDGPGIPAGAEQKIFEKFYRSSQTTDGGRGSGLGLAICRAIIDVHGGSITAENSPSGGSTFVIRMPLVKGAPQVPAGSL